MEKKETNSLTVLFSSQTVHSRSSPADAGTPTNQKSRVKKKAAKSSGYRRDLQGGVCKAGSDCRVCASVHVSSGPESFSLSPLIAVVLPVKKHRQ